MSNFLNTLCDNSIHFFDGGMGTMLQAKGLGKGQSPEEFGLNNLQVVEYIHRAYVEAGATVITTNTFGGTRVKLPSKIDVVQLNKEMAAAAKRAAQGRAFVAGSVGPTGHFCPPIGKMSFREMADIFSEQIKGLVAGGVDLIIVETQFDLAESRAAVIAARQTCNLPVAVSMTFEEGVCLTGTPPLTFVDTMQNMGVDLIATNCSAGPEQILDVVKAMLPRLRTPLLVQPNAGLPELDENGDTVFRLSPEAFATQMLPFVKFGVKFIGGCCGTTPEHIRQVKEAVGEKHWALPTPQKTPCLVVTSRSVSVPVGTDLPAKLIGERINPTGKKQLTLELQKGELTEATRLALEQEQAGAHILDINVGAPMVDEKVMLPRVLEHFIPRINTPLCLDSTNKDALTAALNVYPGSALINSISGEPGRMQELGPLCKLYGAPFVLLPLSGSKLPVTAAQRLAVLEDLITRALDMGIPKELILVDTLVLTVSSKPEAAKACLDVIRHCRETWGLPTTCGLSNISFGLPARALLNSAFVSMSLGAGLSSCIANPSTPSIQQALAASEVLLNRDPQAAHFIAHYADYNPKTTRESGPEKVQKTAIVQVETLYDAILYGAKDSITDMLDKELDKGKKAFALINKELIPAITAVGEKYERKEYFLPQLLLSAETMSKAFTHLKPLLEKDGESGKKTKVVMATVEGDIHDIGKNIVTLMLRNNGYEVIDLGKDVPAKTIVQTAEKEKAAVIGLSALMTTTMVRMEETVRLVEEKKLPAKVIIGGAVVSKAYADTINAHGYSEDAVGCVKLVNSLISESP